MNEIVEKIEYKGFTIQVLLDEFPESPRNWDNLGTMLCAHPRYNLGDQQFSSPQQAYDEAEANHFPSCVFLPLYLYDHGGVTMKVGRFYEPWDSGQVGYIVVGKEAIRKEWKCKRISRKLRDIVESNLRIEVETYNYYLQGEVYGYAVVDDAGQEVDSLWGYYGSDHEKSGLMEAARESIDFIIEDRQKFQAERLEYVQQFCEKASL